MQERIALMIWKKFDSYHVILKDARVLAGWILALINQEPVEKWIPVSERLPENGASVMTFPHYEVYPYKNNGFWTWSSYNDCEAKVEYKITHWMPLPDPPKEATCKSK